MGGAGGDLKRPEAGGSSRGSVQVAEGWRGRRLWEEVKRNDSVREEEEQTPCEFK